MSQKKFGLVLGLMAASGIAVADSSWVAPAPMGPYGGHFDFGSPAEMAEGGVADTPQAEYAMYRQGEEQLPVIQAAYSPLVEEEISNAEFRHEELSNIDPAWSLNNEPQEPSQAAAINGVGQQNVDVWALGEIQPGKLPQLLNQEPAEQKMQPCVANQTADHRPMSTTSTPFQEAMLDEFEASDIDMEAMAREADRLSMNEEYRDHGWEGQQPPVYYPSFMPDYALGVRRANAMDPLALIPQMRSPVQYFGFQ